MNQFSTTKELEQFCCEHGFLFHAHGACVGETDYVHDYKGQLKLYEHLLF